jgi:hypothetical protein
MISLSGFVIVPASAFAFALCTVGRGEVGAEDNEEGLYSSV